MASDPASTAGIRAFGVPLTPIEIGDLERRIAASDEISQVVAAYGQEHPQSFGGSYIDPVSGRVIAQFVGDLEAPSKYFGSIVRPGAPLEVEQVQWLLKDLKAAEATIRSGIVDLESQGIRIIGLGIRPSANQVEVEVESDRTDVLTFIEQSLDLHGRIKVNQSPLAPAGPTGTLRGYAIGVDRKPAPGLDVRLELDGHPYDIADIAYTTGADGGFIFPRLPAGRYVVTLLDMSTGSGVEVGSASVVVLPEGTANVDVTVSQ